MNEETGEGNVSAVVCQYSQVVCSSAAVRTVSGLYGVFTLLSSD